MELGCLRRFSLSRSRRLPVTILLFILLFVSLVQIPTTYAITISPGAPYFGIGNTNYTVGHTMTFDIVDVNSTHMRFNGTMFRTLVPVATKVNITLNFLHVDPFGNDTSGTLLINYTGYAGTTSQPVELRIGGLHTDYSYTVYKDGVSDVITNAVSGNISYTNSSGTWDGSNHYFEIKVSGAVPIVTTNPATGIGYTNTTLQGYLDDGGALPLGCTVRFEYGTTIGYGSSTVNQTKASGQSFSQDVTLLSGTLYHFRAVADDGVAVSYGSDESFTTLSYTPSTLPNPRVVHANWTTTSSVNLSWTKGTGATNTILIRKTGSYPTSKTDGSLIYNNTGSYYNNTGLNPSTRYFYRLYSFTSGNFSSGINAILSETDNATGYGASWLEFTGYLTTDKTTQAMYLFSDDSSFGNVNVNNTVNETGFSNVTASYDSNVYSNHWAGQVFKTGSTRYYPYNVTVKVRRNGNPGLLYCRLYSANTSTWQPSGGVLASGSRNANSVSYSSYEWFNITLSNYYLTKNTRYCIVLYLSGGSTMNMIGWNRYNYDGYSYGQPVKSSDHGSTYSNITGCDMLFKIWGHEPTTYPSGMNTSNTTKTITGYINITQNNLDPGVLYYYRMQANDTKGNMTKGNIRYSLTNPDVPIFMTITPDYAAQEINISWTKGTGANRTIIIKGEPDYPDSPSDGLIQYNGTGTYAVLTNTSFNETYHMSLFSFTVWGELSRFSTGATIPWGGISFNCFNESNSDPIGFSVLVSNKAGDKTYYGPDLYGWQFINSTEIPMGDNIGFYISNSTGLYNSRLYYYDIEPDIFYNFSFYLPPTTTPPEAPDSYLYYLNIRETVWSGDYAYDVDVEGVKVTIKKYLESEDKFVTTASMITDAAGLVNVYLIPGVWYKVYLNKTGYYNSTNDYIPSPPNEWGQTEVKTFKIIAIISGEEELDKTFYLYCTFTGELYENNTLKLSYVDSLCNTTDALFLLYEEYNGTFTYMDQTSTTECSLVHWFSGLNHSRSHKIILHLNHTDFGWINVTINVNPWVSTSGATRKWIEDISTDVFGKFDPGWVNFFVIFIPCLFVLIIPGNKNLEFGIVIVGLALGLISVKISLTPEMQALIPFIIFIGILFAVVKHGKVKI